MTGRMPSQIANRAAARHLKAVAIFAALAFTGWPAICGAQESAPGIPKLVSLPVDPEALLDQALYVDSAKACAPAALANCLRQGPEPMRRAWAGFVGNDDTTRFRYLIDRWFRTPASAVFPRKKRFSFDGVLEEDLVAATTEMLEENQLPPFEAGYLDRLPGEKSPAFLARIHRKITASLAEGVPPILSLKTYVARRFEKHDDEVRWEPANHHWVVITAANAELRPTDLGFSIDLIDPNGGRRTSAYIYAENRLEFWALKGNPGTGEWLDGRPFLLVQAPGVLSLRPKEAEWTDRIIVVANFLVGRYEEELR